MAPASPRRGRAQAEEEGYRRTGDCWSNHERLDFPTCGASSPLVLVLIAEIPACAADFHSADFARLGDHRFRHREPLRPGAGLCVIVHRPPLDERSKDLPRQALAAYVPTYLIEDERAVPRRFRGGDDRLA